MPLSTVKNNVHGSYLRNTLSLKSLLLFILGTCFVFPLSAHADDDPHAMGLIPPSPEEMKWDRANMIVPQRVKINALGLSRVNASLLKNGQKMLAASAVEISAIGEEVEGFTEDQRSLLPPLASPLGAPTALPPAVDNSTLKYFPPIGSQGGLGSCAQWAGIYYCFTYMNALARDWDAKDGGDAFRFSPKFTYNMLNGGVNQGTWQTSGWAIAQNHGAATWQDWPYDGDYLGWPLTASIWRNALNVRVNTTGIVGNCDTPTGLEQLKTFLVNGYILTFSTYILSWQLTTISNDPSTTDDDAFVGKEVGYWVSGTNGGHAMTVVGYNDSIWVDINGNGIVDTGEKGAFRIANSWGSGWRDGGFTWLAYDALKSVSGVSGAPSYLRGSAWWLNAAYWMTAKPSYFPNALAQFTLAHARRNELKITLGMSETAQSSPSTTWSPFSVLQNAGGVFAFDGGGTSKDASFVLDFSGIASTYDSAKRWYLSVKDSTTGNEATLKAFKWINGVDSTEVAHSALPATVDATQTHFYVDATMTHGQGNTPPTLSSISNQVIDEDTVTGSIAFTVGDAQTAAGSLTVTGASSNKNLLSNYSIALAGSGANRTVVLTPLLNKSGTTTITLTVTDAGGMIAQSSFSLTVNPVNDPPIAEAQTLGLLFNTAKTIVLRGSDVDGNSFTFTPASPSHGTLTGTAPTLTYTPPLGFMGTDSFTFTTSDGLLTSPPATVSLTVDATPPTVTIVQPTNAATIAKNQPVISIASDNVAIGRVVFYLDGVALDTETVPSHGYYWYDWNTAAATNGAHSLTARAYDDAGNDTVSGAVNVTVNNTAPAQMTVEPTSLTFVAAQGGDFPPIGLLSVSTTTSGPYPNWTVTVSTAWLSVSPASGNGPGMVSAGVAPGILPLGLHTATVTISFPSAVGAGPPAPPLIIPVSLSVLPSVDTTPPTVPTGLSAVVPRAGSVLISWSASTDAGGSGLAGYRLYRDGTMVAEPTEPHFNDSDLKNTTYSYSVEAVDNAENVSVRSDIVQITLSDEETPTGLVDIFSFPEPATRGAPPVVRAVLGDVNNVEITFYDAKGTPVHSARMEAPNTIVNGQAAYDYSWAGDIPSGVYYAVIHGNNGTQTVKARTQLTVIR